MLKLNRLLSLPPTSSREMRAYMQAILEATGVMAGESFDLTKFMGNYRTHLAAGRFEVSADGGFSLTEAGRQYFCSRLTATPETPGQTVDRFEVIEMLRHVTADPAPAGWQRLSSQ